MWSISVTHGIGYAQNAISVCSLSLHVIHSYHSSNSPSLVKTSTFSNTFGNPALLFQPCQGHTSTFFPLRSEWLHTNLPKPKIRLYYLKYLKIYCQSFTPITRSSLHSGISAYVYALQGKQYVFEELPHLKETQWQH